MLSSFARPKAKTLIVKFRLLPRKTSIWYFIKIFLIGYVSNTDYAIL